MEKVTTTFSHEQASEHFAKVIKLCEAVPPKRLTWVIENQLAEFCGIAALIYHEDDKPVEIGIMLTPKYWGQKLATNVIASLLTVAFNQLNLAKIFGQFDCDNQAIAKLVTGLGFTIEPGLKDYLGMQKQFCHITAQTWAEKSEHRISNVQFSLS